MISSIVAFCDCGFSSELMIGGGSGAFSSLALFPGFCRHCVQLVPANLATTPITCSLCKGAEVTLYDDESLRGQSGSETIASWDFTAKIGRVVTLTDGTYLCPACGKRELRFRRGDAKWGRDEMRLGG
jgi:Zn finger protein HypA/HybF involved in hydrogenase expression